jgi:deoxyribonuclease V
MYDINTSKLSIIKRTTYAEVIKLQKEFAKEVLTTDDLMHNVKSICDVDVSYKKRILSSSDNV